MLKLYTLLLRIGLFFVSVFGRRNTKVRKWLAARDKWKVDLAGFKKTKKLIWFHCASVGEFEQARPVIEQLKSKGEFEIAITFFSSSGYEAKHDYGHADLITYLPADLPENVEPFLRILAPDVAVFVKYEFWFNVMDALVKLKIPMALISAYFPDKHWTIQWPGILLGERLSQFDVIYTQDEMSCNVLASVMIDNTKCAGDTRVDRVLEVKNENWAMESVQRFLGESAEVFIVGSSWPADDRYLIPAIQNYPSLKVIVVPHELHDDQMLNWKKAFQEELVLIDQIDSGAFNKHRVLFVNRVGLLSKLYRYGTAAYIGGGFGKAVHNTLEAAVYGIPVIFGPQNKRFQEIQLLKQLEAGIEINSMPQLLSAMNKTLFDSEYQAMVEASTHEFFESQKGASAQIVRWIVGQVVGSE